jgi:hypothetical protein
VTVDERAGLSSVVGQTLGVTDSSQDDPAWFSWRELPLTLVPAVAIRRIVKTGGSTLQLVRTFFSGYLVMLAAIGLVVVVLSVWADGGSRSSNLSTPIVAVGVTAVGALCLVASQLARSNVDCSTDRSVAEWYRSRFFVRIAFADASALAGFAGFVLVWSAWVYLIGLLFALIGFVRLAPTRNHIERDQVELTANGCRRGLLDSLRLPTPTARR